MLDVFPCGCLQDEVMPDGTRVIIKGSRQAPGRVTVLSDSGEVLLDDYIEVSEVIVDYLTRYDPCAMQCQLVALSGQCMVCLCFPTQVQRPGACGS